MTSTYDPRVTNDLRPLRQLQLRKLSLNALIINHRSLCTENLLSIERRMLILPQPDVVLDALCAEVDDGFMEFVLIPIRLLAIKGSVLVHLPSIEGSN